MIPLPDWAPNVHPLIVHFPIALLFTAALFDAVALIARRSGGFNAAAVMLYAVGAIGALVAFFTGKAAGDQVLLSSAAQTLLTDHADWATRVVWFFGLYALGRLALLRYRPTPRLWMSAAVFLIGAGGLFLVVETGEHGAQMVFQEGVGVLAAQKDHLLQHDHSDHGGGDHDHGDDDDGDHDADHAVNADGHHDGIDDHDAGETLVGRPAFAENGSWQWLPGLDARDVLAREARFLSGTLDDVVTPADDSLLILQMPGRSVLFVLGGDFESIEAEVILNLDQFEGTVQLVHHVQDNENYDFLGLVQNLLQQGRTSHGGKEIFEESSQSSSGWLKLRAVSDKGHFRGYIGDEMLVHGHSSAPGPGPVGLYLDGTGVVMIRSIGATSLR